MPITSQIIGDMTKIDPEGSHGGNMLAERLPLFSALPIGPLFLPLF